jgi:hypothetical protein
MPSVLNHISRDQGHDVHLDAHFILEFPPIKLQVESVLSFPEDFQQLQTSIGMLEGPLVSFVQSRSQSRTYIDTNTRI